MSVRGLVLVLVSMLKADRVKPPDITTAIKDPKTNITYEIMAYRKLTQAEAMSAIREFYAATAKSNRPKSGSTVTIISTLGAD